MSEKNQKSRKYWRRRAIQFEKDWFNRSQKTIEKKLADHYQTSLSAIQDDILKLYGSFAKDNGLNFDEAKKLLNSQEYRRWRMSMQEYLQQIAGGDIGLERELNTLAMRPRINRLEKLYAETLQELDKLGRNVDADIKNFFADSYTGTYAKDIFDLVKVGGLSVAIAKVENIHVEKVLASRWSGKTFSQRIWTNTKLLNGVLRETISSGVHRGLSIPQMSRMVEDKMNAGYKNAVRLVRTEMNFFNNQAHADSMADAGVAAYEFIAVMDNRTSAACRSRDGETYPLEEKTVGFNYPPLHPRCRSTVCPFIEGVSRKGTRTAKVGGKNIDIPENMKYADYEKVYIKKEISFDDWQKNNSRTAENNNLTITASSGKLQNNGSRIVNGVNVTPRDLLPKGGINVKTSEPENDIEAYRKKTEKLTFKPVTEEQYNNLIIPLKKMGVTIMRGGEKVESHLDLRNAQASNLGTDIVLFREKISMSAILEETYHIIQNRNGLNDDKDTTLRSILNEIDAKKHLLEIASNYGIPREEIAETELQLKQYEKELQAYYAERGEDNV